MPKENRRKQKCALCRHHGILVDKCGHKNCLYENSHLGEDGEICSKCNITMKRRTFGANEIRRIRKFCNKSPINNDTTLTRNPQECRKCRIHKKYGVKTAGGHRNFCKYINCKCNGCIEIDSLRTAMKFENNDKRQKGDFEDKVIKGKSRATDATGSESSDSECYVNVNQSESSVNLKNVSNIVTWLNSDSCTSHSDSGYYGDDSGNDENSEAHIVFEESFSNFNLSLVQNSSCNEVKSAIDLFFGNSNHDMGQYSPIEYGNDAHSNDQFFSNDIFDISPSISTHDFSFDDLFNIFPVFENNQYDFNASLEKYIPITNSELINL